MTCRSAEDDPTLAPRWLKGGTSCLATPSCMLVSNKAWCKKHADKLGVGYKSEHSGPCDSVCNLLGFLFANSSKISRHKGTVFELLLE